MVPCHPSLQSTRTRRPGLIRIYTIPPVHHLQCPILWTKPNMRTLQQLPSFKGRPTRLGRATLQLATAGNCSGQRKRHSGRRALGKTPRTPFAFKDSMIHCILQWYRILLRSSSMHKPRDPPLEVVNGSVWPRGLSKHHTNSVVLTKRLWPQGPRPRLLAEQLNRAPQGQADDRIPTEAGTPSVWQQE